jgi:hypothetical protein
MSNRNRLFAALGALIVIVVGLTAFSSWFTTATVTITASRPDATITVKQADKSFELGNGSVIFKTRNTARIFIEAKVGKDGGLTQKNIEPRRRQNTPVNLEVKALAKAEQVGRAPYLYPLIENSLIYGVSPYNGYLEVGPLAKNPTTQLPRLPFLPILKQVVWRDSKNFIYITTTKGAGVVSTQPELTRKDLPYTAVAPAGNNTVALLSNKGLHLAQGLALANARVVARPLPNTFPFLFADSRFIFYGRLVFEEHQEEAEEDHLTLDEVETPDPGIQNAQVLLFDHRGNRLKELTVPTRGQVYKVLSLDDQRLVVLASDGLHLVSIPNGTTDKKEFSFGEVKDMLLHKNKLLLLGSAGLWEYGINNDEYHKVASYPVGEAYIPYSLATFKNELYFSTLVEEGGFKKNPRARNSLFRIELEN